MNADDIPKFTELMTGICVLYGKSPSDALMELYWRALESFDFEVVKTALEAHVSNSDSGQFMPKPADVMRYVQGSSQTQGLLAWSKVMQAVKSVGLYQSIVFDDPLIHAVIEDMGGWINLCMTPTKDAPFRANEFEKRYAAYVLHPPLHYPKQLIGLTEGQNRMNGYLSAIKPPLLLGDKARALSVLQDGREKPLTVHVLTASLTEEALPLDSTLEHSIHE